ncbi:hypothetical protein [Dyadobacter soli]|nr:hypothetical protein [Dyadobacter soli]
MKFSETLLKGFAFAVFLGSCNNEQPIIPVETTSVNATDQNAKINAVLKLYKYGNDAIQYVKSGKFMGQVSRVSNASKYQKYTYNDNNGTTNLFITSSSYLQSTNAKFFESVYEISNGRCIANKESNGATYDYKYNVLGQLEEVFMVYQGFWLKSTYSYIFNAATNAYRLDKIVAVNQSGPVRETKFTYTAIPKKYQLNPDNVDTDLLLPFFGTFSDVLIKDVEVKSLAGAQSTEFREYNYIIDNAGHISSRTEVYHPLGKASNSSLSTTLIDYKYTQYWQGL